MTFGSSDPKITHLRQGNIGVRECSFRNLQIDVWLQPSSLFSKVKTRCSRPYVSLCQMSDFWVLVPKNHSFETGKHRGSRVQFSQLANRRLAAAQLTFLKSENAMFAPLCFLVSNGSFLSPRTTFGASRLAWRSESASRFLHF